MGRAGGLLVDGTAEEHLRIGVGALLEDAGDAGAPLELLQLFFMKREGTNASTLTPTLFK